jgi:hypothetical protein
MISNLAKMVNDGEKKYVDIKEILGDFTEDVKTLGKYDEKILKCKEDLQKKLDELTNKK